MGQNKGFVNSFKFIFGFMKKYTAFLIIVVVLIVFTTYFQVISPKLMGNSIDEMTKYLGQTKIQRVLNDIDQEKGLTDKQKETLIKNKDFDDETKQKIQDASPEELKKEYDTLQLLDKVYSKDNEMILRGEGLSQSQKETLINSQLLTAEQNEIILSTNIVDLKNSELLTEEQQMSVSALGNAIQKSYLKWLGGLTDVERDSIPDLSIEQGEQLYYISQVRLEAIKLNEDVLNTGEWDANQIDYIKSKNLDATVENTILNASVEELNNAWDNKKVELSPEKQYKVFMRSLLLLFLSYIALAFVMFFYNYFMAIISGNTTRDMRKGMFGKIEELSIRFFDTINAGDLLSRFTNDIDNISNALTQSVIQVLSQGAMLIGIIYMMFLEDTTTAQVTIFGQVHTINNILVWSMFLFAIFAIGLAFLIIRKARYYVSKQQTKLGDLNGYIDERISGQKVVISYGLEEETIEHFDQYNKDLRETSTKGQVYSGVLMPLMQGIGLVNLGFLVFLGSQYVISGVITIGLLAAFIQYSQRFFNPLAQVVSQYNMLELAAAGGSRAKDVFDQKPEVVNEEGAQPISGIEGNVVLDNVSFGYDENKLVLKNIDLEVHTGQMIALVGPTGSGKTTVMNLMNRFYDVTEGEIRFDGKPIKEITLDTLRKNVGIVLQESILFGGTIKSNIAYGKPEATDDEIIEAAKLANIHEFIMTLEEGYNTSVDNNTSMFSTGQKQLISIARTILTDPDLLILDEATSNVDTVTEERIQKAMDNIIHGRTSFVIAHRLKTILGADKIIVLKDGEILESGNHRELLDQKGFYSELYHNQFVVEEE